MDYLEKPLSPVRLSEAAASALARPKTIRPAPAVPAKATTASASAPAEMQPCPRGEPAVAPEVASAMTAAGNVTRLLVTGSVGFLLGVAAAYIVAPSHGLAYLLVGTAIGSGTLLGLFSDALFARSTRAKSPRDTDTAGDGARDRDALSQPARAVSERT